MTCLSWACARHTSGVSAGTATTSRTVSAASTTSGATGRSSAAGPPAIPTGVALTSRWGRPAPTSPCQAYPYRSARAIPVRGCPIASAEPSSSSTSSTQASLYGIEMPHPRMPRARIPAMAAARSVVVNALYTKSRSSSA
jgi:hypothetical protein